MQGIFQKENTDKALKYGIYRHLPTYEKIIRNLVSFYTKYLYKNLFLSGQIGNKDHTFINDLSGDGNAFSHCKGCKDSSDSKTFDVTEEEACHTGSCKQTDNIKRDLNNRIFLLYNL